MKTTIDLLHVNAKEVSKGLTLLDDILELQSGAEITNEAIIRSCNRIHMNAQDDLSAVCKTTMEVKRQRSLADRV